MKKLFLGVYHPSVILTYIGVVISVFGIFCVNDLYLAVILLMIAGLCDAFDGIFARRYKRTKLQEDFGVQIDSLADLISFGVFPAKIYRVFFSDCIYVSTVLLSFYILAVIIRLAYFNCTADEDKEHFTGLAVTYSAFFISLYVVLCKYIKVLSVIPIEYLYVLLILGFLWNKKIKKPNIYVRIGFLVLAMVFIVGDYEDKRQENRKDNKRGGRLCKYNQVFISQLIRQNNPEIYIFKNLFFKAAFDIL